MEGNRVVGQRGNMDLSTDIPQKTTDMTEE